MTFLFFPPLPPLLSEQRMKITKVVDAFCLADRDPLLRGDSIRTALPTAPVVKPAERPLHHDSPYTVLKNGLVLGPNTKWHTAMTTRLGSKRSDQEKKKQYSISSPFFNTRDGSCRQGSPLGDRYIVTWTASPTTYPLMHSTKCDVWPVLMLPGYKYVCPILNCKRQVDVRTYCVVCRKYSFPLLFNLCRNATHWFRN